MLHEIYQMSDITQQLPIDCNEKAPLTLRRSKVLITAKDVYLNVKCSEFRYFKEFLLSNMQATFP